jgi:hypothetical protein
MLVAKLQQRNPKILPLISTLLFVHMSSMSFSLSHFAQAFHDKPYDQVAIFQVSSFIKESMHFLDWFLCRKSGNKEG